MASKREQILNLGASGKQSTRPCKRTNRHLNILFTRPNVTDPTQAAVAALHRGIVEL